MSYGYADGTRVLRPSPSGTHCTRATGQTGRSVPEVPMPPAAAARRATSGTRVVLDEFARRNNPRLRGLATMRKNEIQSNTTKYNRRMYEARERSQGGILAGGDLPPGKYNRLPLDVVTRDTLPRSRKGTTRPPEPPRRRVGSLGKACARPFQRAMSTHRRCRPARTRGAGRNLRGCTPTTPLDILYRTRYNKVKSTTLLARCSGLHLEQGVTREEERL